MRESVEHFIALMEKAPREIAVERIPDSNCYKVTHIPSGIVIKHYPPITSKASYFLEHHLELTGQEQHSLHAAISAWMQDNKTDMDDFHDELIAAKLKGFL